VFEEQLPLADQLPYREKKGADIMLSKKMSPFSKHRNNSQYGLLKGSFIFEVLI